MPGSAGRIRPGLHRAPETLALSKPPFDLKALPFNPLEVMKDMDRLPFEPSVDADADE
jgi:hypothetical protein